MGLSAVTGKHSVFGHLGLAFIWSCFVFCLLFLLFYAICAPVPAEAAYLIVTATNPVPRDFTSSCKLREKKIHHKIEIIYYSPNLLQHNRY